MRDFGGYNKKTLMSIQIDNVRYNKFPILNLLLFQQTKQKKKTKTKEKKRKPHSHYRTTNTQKKGPKPIPTKKKNNQIPPTPL